MTGLSLSGQGAVKRLGWLEQMRGKEVILGNRCWEDLHLADVPQWETLGAWLIKTCGLSVGTRGNRFWVMVKLHWCTEEKHLSGISYSGHPL